MSDRHDRVVRVLNAQQCDWAGREKGWMGTASGRKFYPLDPSADAIDLVSVARGLAMTCRYGGQVKRFYSVAEHCYWVSHFVPFWCAREALVHDSAEAYIGDMIRPLKHQPEMEAFRDAEYNIEREVFLHFKVSSTFESRRAVKRVDNRILVNEINALSARPDYYLETPMLRDLEPLPLKLKFWTPRKAEKMYLRRYKELFG